MSDRILRVVNTLARLIGLEVDVLLEKVACPHQLRLQAELEEPIEDWEAALLDPALARVRKATLKARVKALRGEAQPRSYRIRIG